MHAVGFKWACAEKCSNHKTEIWPLPPSSLPDITAIWYPSRQNKQRKKKMKVLVILQIKSPDCYIKKRGYFILKIY